jgi:hypothetical protein
MIGTLAAVGESGIKLVTLQLDIAVSDAESFYARSALYLVETWRTSHRAFRKFGTLRRRR